MSKTDKKFLITNNIMKTAKFFIAVAFTAIAGNASAQLSVVDNGQIHIGIRKTTTSSASIDATTSPIEIDNNARLVILGNGRNNTNGRISFGDSDHVLIGEDQGENYLALKGDNGLTFRMGSTTYFRIRETTLLPRTVYATFKCAVDATAFNTTSDLRLKKDVASLGDSYLLLSDVNSISYRLLPKPVTMSEGDEDMMDMAPAVPDDRVHFGFAAQEIKELFPELVMEDEDGYMSIDYNGFIPLLVDAYKNLAARNEELEAKVEGILNPAKKTVSSADGILMESATLAQNRPNPFTDSTVIDITLPSEVADAMLYVYDMQGTQVMQLPVEGRGKTAVSIDGRTLRAGMYLYTLIADGEEVATKRMILTE